MHKKNFFSSKTFEKNYQSSNIEVKEIFFKENEISIYLKFFKRKKKVLNFFSYNILESFDDIEINGNINNFYIEKFYDLLIKECKINKIHSLRLKKISPKNKNLFKNIFKNNNFKEITWSSNKINLNENIEIIKLNFNATTRNMINNNLEKLKFKVCSNYEDFERFYHSYINSSGNSENIENMYNMKDFYSKHNLENLTLFYNEDINSQNICSNAVFGNDNENAYMIKIGKNRSLNNKFCIEILIWKIILFYKKKNINFFDFNGFNPNPINKKEIGIKFSKVKWGGEIYNYFNYEKKFLL